MLQNSFGIHVSTASVDSGDGSDPRDAATRVLSRLRVPAGLRDATAAWEDREEAVLAIPVTDDGHVLTLSADDRIESTLTTAELRSAFREQQLTLWLDADGDTISADDGVEDVVADGEVSDDDPGQTDHSEIDLTDAPAFDLPTVQVSTFSHRGPVVARILATAHRVTVDHEESGEWSLQRLETSEVTDYWTTSKADLPLIEWNRAESGSWFVVTGRSGVSVPFWTHAERDTRPVLDIGAITVPETAEIYRRLLTEGDGNRDELADIADAVPLDVDAAHRALMPESLGGVIGEQARQRAFIAAFGVPVDLIDIAAGAEAGSVGRRFLPVSWGVALRETAIAGFGEATPLTRRHRPIARFADAVRRRPVWGLALSLGELGIGAWTASRTRGVGRGIGILLVTDALIDTIIWIVRIRRSGRL